MPARLAKRLFRSGSLHVSAWLLLGGVAYTLGNLAFAAALEPADFGRLALFQALLGVASGLAPLGLDQLVVRRELQVGPASLWRTFGAGAAVAMGAALTALLGFGLSRAAVILLVAGVLGSAAARVSAAVQQGALRFGRGQLVLQVPFMVFGVGGFVVAGLGTSDWAVGAAFLAGGYVAAACSGVAMQLRDPWKLEVAVPPSPDRQAWGRALTFAGILASAFLLHQMERLVIPVRIGLAELGTYALVATVVASPYRLLHGGVAYALMPRIRAQSGAEGWRRVIRFELALVAVLGLGGGLVLLAVADPFIRLLYGEKYLVSLPLVVALVVAGIVRVFYAVPAAGVSALGVAGELRRFSALGWLATAVAAGGAAFLARYGLPGVVVGVALGWLVRLIAAAVLLRAAFARARAAGPPAGTAQGANHATSR